MIRPCRAPEHTISDVGLVSEGQLLLCSRALRARMVVACWVGEDPVEGPPLSVGCVDRRARGGDLGGSQDQPRGAPLTDEEREPC